MKPDREALAYDQLVTLLRADVRDALVPDPRGLSTRTISDAFEALRRDIDATLSLVEAFPSHSPRIRVPVRALVERLLEALSDLRFVSRPRDILVIDSDECATSRRDAWPTVRKHRVALSDWDIWTLDTVREQLRAALDALARASRNRTPRRRRPTRGPAVI